MKKVLLAVVAVVLLGAAGFLGWQTWSGGGDVAKKGGALGVVKGAVGSLAAKAGIGPPDDSPIRCRVGKQVQLVRRLDCAQRGGEVLEGGSGGYTKLSKEEMEARFGKPAAPAKPAEQAPAATP